MASGKNGLNHADCCERDISEWKKIFSLSLKAYGWRIDRYKGKQKLVYLPDMIDGKMVCFLGERFSGDFAVICSKRLWDKFAKHPSMDKNRVLTAVAFLKHPEFFPKECTDHVLHYVTSQRNRSEIVNEILKSDDAEAMIAYFMTALITSNSKTFKLKELEKTGEILEKAHRIQPFLSNLSQTKTKENIVCSQWFDNFTLPQIEMFTRLAHENNTVSMLAWLLDYNNKHFEGHDPMDKYTLGFTV